MARLLRVQAAKRGYGNWHPQVWSLAFGLVWPYASLPKVWQALGIQWDVVLGCLAGPVLMKS
eukprot:2075120-Prorocentrum_lima.AAC.1